MNVTPASISVALGVVLGAVALFLTRQRPAAAAAAPSWKEYDMLSSAVPAEFAWPSVLEYGRMRLSDRGLSALKRREGFRAKVYNDSAGYPTIGYGHKLTASEQGMLATVTEQQAASLLADDVQTAEDAVNDLVDVPMNQDQFDALVSWVYNLGRGAFERSTLRKRVNAGDIAGAVAEFGRWVYAGGSKLAGLVSRRASEAAQFQGLPS